MRITGVVQPGKHIGRTLGFPTANILADAPEAPRAQNGVYVARLTLEDGRALGCVLNKGRHPTLPDGAPTVEAHILDFDADLYGRRVTVELLHFLRPERRFASVETLREQIARDAEDARAWLAAHAEEPTNS